ncbi:Glyoxalase/Bleomycin resistance protein/Dihydroxybiphenyl dioxygenase [Aspergillus pseudoustus]|uniref:Glyoxalase/Bleomycin resistance protein/Dihydroxybiphenyl dioxygenase n=1 Tax=Aspergillus pseudoustus TaxID=1810923 RepID=A0ABR4IJY5_9EURO
MSTPNNLPINHVAVSVRDIEAVTAWYTNILGFQLIGNRIFHIKRSESPAAPIFAIYGESLHEVKLAYMATGNGVGFEVFQFVDPPPFEEKPERATSGAFKFQSEYRGTGFFHICVTDADPRALAERVVAGGGQRQGEMVRVAAGTASCQYVRDPWGNVVELLDASFDRTATADVVRGS